jgi:hypothetical protein
MLQRSRTIRAIRMAVEPISHQDERDGLTLMVGGTPMKETGIDSAAFSTTVTSIIEGFKSATGTPWDTWGRLGAPGEVGDIDSFRTAH